MVDKPVSVLPELSLRPELSLKEYKPDRQKLREGLGIDSSQGKDADRNGHRVQRPAAK